MADDITLNSGSGGATLATDDISSVHYQRVKINYGADGSATDVSATNPLPVLGAQTEDAVHSTGDAGMHILGVRNDTLASLVGADGDYAPLQVNASGALYTSDQNMESVKGTVGSASPNDVVVIGCQDTSGDVRQPLILNTSNDNQATTQLALLTTTRLFGYEDGGGVWDRVHVNGSGQLEVDVAASGVLDTIDTNTSPSGSHYRNIDANAEDAIKGLAGTLHWLHVMNMTAAVAYLHLYDATTGNVTPGTTTPDFTFPLPTQGDTNGAGFNLPLGPNGQAFANAITLVVTTTTDGSTGDPGTNGVFVNAGYS